MVFVSLSPRPRCPRSSSRWRELPRPPSKPSRRSHARTCPPIRSISARSISTPSIAQTDLRAALREHARGERAGGLFVEGPRAPAHAHQGGVVIETMCAAYLAGLARRYDAGGRD